MYYATYHPYNVHSVNIDGTRANELLGFNTAAERDAWVADEPEYRQSRSADWANRRIIRPMRRRGYSLWEAQSATDNETYCIGYMERPGGHCAV